MGLSAETTGHGERGLDSPKRVEWLEGLRGVASVQVVLLHYTSAFLPSIGLFDPALAHYGWEKLIGSGYAFVALNGYGAVWMFFILSGVALTISFGARPFSLTSSIVRRVIRLGIPMACALAFGAVVLSALPRAAAHAAAITHSNAWLGQLHNESFSWGQFVHQLIFEGLFTGYLETSVFPLSWLSERGVHLISVSNSLNAPLWTLSIEFYGSLLVLGLTLIRASMPRWAHAATAVFVLLLSLPSPFWLFVVGHLIEPVVRHPPRKPVLQFVGVALIILGVALCGAVPDRAIFELASRFPMFRMAGPPLIGTQFSIGETFLFAGICLIPAVRSALQVPLLKKLGKLSFSLYLVHFPILLTFSCATFLLLQGHTSYALAGIFASILGIGLTAPAAVAFRKLVDEPAIGLSRSASRRRLFLSPKTGQS